MKTDRLAVIRKIISTNAVNNQETLQSLLEQQGIYVTQATLSRDIRSLGIVKVHDRDKGYCYKLNDDSVSASAKGNPKFTVESIKSVEFNQFAAVIKTYPGFAAAVASIIDGNVRDCLMGTLAGDDTVLLILRQPCDPNALLKILDQYIYGISTKMI